MRDSQHVLRVYVSGASPKSAEAIKHIKNVCDEYLAGDYDLEIVDVYQEPRLENLLRRANERIDIIVDSITDRFFVFDDEWRYTYFNKHAQEQIRILGKDPMTLLGKVAWEEFATEPAVEEAFRRAKADRAVTTFEHYYPLLGEWVENRIYPAVDGGVAVFQRYVTERKRTEEALRKAQAELAHANRLATIGELTVSIAHEINQPLGAIVTTSEACRRWLARDTPDLDEARQAIERVTEDAFRASSVIKRMRLLATKSAAKREPLNVNDLIRETIAFTAGELTDNHVSWQLDLQPGMSPVLGDRVQLEQVLLNLIVNSIEAMSTVDWATRTLLVRSAQDQPDELTITVDDSGIGLPPDSELIFESFVSSKPNGLGLGLSISRTIVDAHGGRLWAMRSAGPGATFYLALPSAGPH
jgi:C4-dicarboxylate-specific signal transduction histidine kinase